MSLESHCFSVRRDRATLQLRPQPNGESHPDPRKIRCRRPFWAEFSIFGNFRQSDDVHLWRARATSTTARLREVDAGAVVAESLLALASLLLAPPCPACSNNFVYAGAVFLPWFSVSRLVAKALPATNGSIDVCKAFTLLHLCS